MTKVAAVLIGIACLSSSVQEKGQAQAPEWVEVVPDTKEVFDAKRVWKLDEGLVLEVALIRKEFFGRDAVTVHGWISNPTRKKLKGEFHVALLDEDKRLVVCGVGVAGVIDAVDPGAKKEQLSAILEAPSAELDRIKLAQYRWSVHE